MTHTVRGNKVVVESTMTQFQMWEPRGRVFATFRRDAKGCTAVNALVQEYRSLGIKIEDRRPVYERTPWP